MTFAGPKEWRNWLAKNYTLQTGVWIKIAKKDSGIASVTRAQALDEALCFGWIDGQAKSIDDSFYYQKFTPRRARSMWSKVNIGKVEVLIAEGKMQASGMAEIERAKADGRWDAAYASPANAVMPHELEAAFKTNKKAKDFFESLNKTNKYAVIWRIETARTPETRARRLAKLMAMLEAGEKLH